MNPQCSCGVEYLWDWDQDEYVSPDGTVATVQNVPIKTSVTVGDLLAGQAMYADINDAWFPLTEVLDRIDTYHCHRCSRSLGLGIQGPSGMIVLKPRDLTTWQDIDWQDHAYQPSRRLQ